VDPRFAPVADAFATDRQVTYGMMMASIGLKVSGKIFAMMVKGRQVAEGSSRQLE
jgi:TfoX/Sxy family transcriptional regulator of competence genes